MSWTEVDWSNVAADNTVLPENVDLTFELLPGARYGKFDPSRIEASAKVANGEFKDRISYFSYPDPIQQPWVQGVFIRMVNVAEENGFERIAEGEDPVDFLNRIAGTHFVSRMKHRLVTSGGVEGQTVADIKIGNIKALNK